MNDINKKRKKLRPIGQLKIDTLDKLDFDEKPKPVKVRQLNLDIYNKDKNENKTSDEVIQELLSTETEPMSEEDKSEFIKLNEETKIKMVETLLDTIESYRDVEKSMDKMLKEMNEFRSQIDKINEDKVEENKRKIREDKILDEIINRDNNKVRETALDNLYSNTITVGHHEFLNTLAIFDMKNIDFSNYVLKNKLKEILDQRRIKQKDLANILEVTTATISNIINNRYSTTIELGFKIAMILGLEFTDIFYYEKEEFQPY